MLNLTLTNAIRVLQKGAISHFLKKVKNVCRKLQITEGKYLRA